MYYVMNWEIHIGDYRLMLIESVKIISSVELLADTAEITLPGTAYGKALEVEDKIKTGDTVTIKLGQDDDLKTEFTGFLQNVNVNGGSITLQCEDGLFNFRKAVADKVLKNITLKDLLQYLVQQIGGGYTVVCSYDFKYEKYVIKSATAYDVLKKVQEETAANIYLKGTELHVHPIAEYVGNDVIYDFAVNVEKDDLKYMRADQRKYEVEVEGMTKDGKTKKVIVGTTGGDRRSVKIYGVTDDASLKKRGEQELKRLVYDGYEGTITGWLVPFVQSGDAATIRDSDYPAREGRYFVTSVTTEFSESGDIRKLQLGIKLSS